MGGPGEALESAERSEVPDTPEPTSKPDKSDGEVRVRPLWQRVLFTVLKVAIGAALVVFLGLQLHASWVRVRAEAIEVSIHWPLMILSILLQAAAYYALGLAWYRGFVALGGGKVPWYAAVYGFAWTNLVRYVPGPVGKALLPVSRSAAFKPYGVPASVTIASMGLEAICTILLGLLIFAVTIPFQAMSDPKLRAYAWACLLVIPLLAALHPKVFQWLVSRMGRLLREDVGECRISFRDQLGVLGWWLIAWSLLAGSFYPYVASVAQVPASQAVLIAASYAFAWVMSMILLVMPAGLGIREGILVLLLDGPVGALAGILAVASRLWTLVAEGVCLLTAFLIYLAFGRGQAPDPVEASEVTETATD
jgi:hypothetical protein